MTDITPEAAMELLGNRVTGLHADPYATVKYSDIEAVLAAIGLTPTSAASLMAGEAVVVTMEAIEEFRSDMSRMFDEIEKAGCEAIRAAAQQKGQG